jgi:predicted dithiol-disulfide oxidoreductase (DUF899 family)
MSNEIQKLEDEIGELSQKLLKARRAAPLQEIKNYTLHDLTGEVSLAELFAGKEKMIVIHNMGQGCRYCTLWADGFNSFVPHLEDKFSLVLMSKDAPELQRKFANSRGWRFRMVSHSGGEYIKEQTVTAGKDNDAGIVYYEKKGDKIFRKTSSKFGPGDQFCSMWHILSMAGFGEEEWTPQYNYWTRPQKMDDGGNNLLT